MGKIIKKVIVEGTKETIEVNALFDSGTTDTILDQKIAEKIGYEFIEPKEFEQAEKENIMIGSIIEIKSLNIQGCKKPRPQISMVKNQREELIIGQDFLQKIGIIIDMEKDDITIKNCGIPRGEVGQIRRIEVKNGNS